MIVLAIIFAALSGALTAALVCKGVRLGLWLDVLAGVGAVAGMWSAAILAGAHAWPLAGFLCGYGSVVVYVRVRRA